MKSTIFIAVLLIALGCTTAQLNQTMSEVNKAMGTDKPLTTDEVAAGLKEALIKGTTTGSDQASMLDGYFKNPQIKIPLPPDIQKIESKVRSIGLGKEVDKFILTLNRGAEDAAKEAKPIFISAIKQMTVQDAWGILKGSDNAATEYLKRTTSAQLREKFQPVIANSLQKVEATKYYSTIVTNYNKIPMVEKVNPDLNDYATTKAMDGLFLLIANEEKKIREDPIARTSELLKKVFGYKK
jgi:hypothetical protein